jgi:polar amino acid transport system substrate-binding protein
MFLILKRGIEMKLTKKSGLILAVVMLLCMSLALGACGDKDDKGATDTASDTSLTDIQDKGVLVLGCDDEFPPMGFVDEKGELVGFDLELAAAVADKLGVTLEPKPIDWDTKELELSGGNIDVIWNGYSITEERNDKVEFTKPYLNNLQVIVVKVDSDINSKGDLAGKTLGAQVGSYAEELVNDDADFLGSLKELRGYDTYQQSLIDLESSDRIQAVAVDKVLVEYVMLQEPGKFRILDEDLGDDLYGIGCPKGAVALREAIDKALDELAEDGTVEALCAKWFESNIVIRDIPKLTNADF